MAKKSRSEYTTLNILAGLVGYILNFLIGLVCRMVFTRTLPADYLGINGLFTNILSMLSLAELGIGSAIIYALYKPLAMDDRPKIASLMRFYGKCYRTIGTIVGVLGVCLMPFLNLLITEQPNIDENLYLIYILYLFSTASSYFFSYRGAMLSAAQQNYLVVGISYLFTIAQSVVQIVLLLTTHNYLYYLLTLILGGLAYNVTISAVAKKKYPYITGKQIQPLAKEERNGLIKNVRALIVWKLSGLLVNQTDSIIITFFSGLTAVGLASNYTLLSGSINTLLNTVFNGLSASVGNHNALETKEHKLSLFRTINLTNFWLFGWAAIGIAVVSSDIVQVLFGEAYVLPIEIPLVIALNFYMVGMQNAVWTYKNTMGLFRPGRYLLIVTAALNLIFSIWLGKLWGLFGILFATAISRALTNTWYDPYAIHKYGFGVSVIPYYVQYFVFALILAVTGGICYFVCAMLNYALLVNVILKFIICCLIPNAVFFACFHKRQEFQQLSGYAKRICGKIAGKLRR